MWGNHSTRSNVEWMDTEDLNLDAVDLSTFLDPFTVKPILESESDVFHDCSSVMLTPD